MVEPGRKISGAVWHVAMYTKEALQLRPRFYFFLWHGLATHQLQHEVVTKLWPQQEIITSPKVAEMFKYLPTLPLYFGLAI